MWLCRWDLLILSHYSAKFGVSRPSESGDITFLICHVTTWSMCVTWLCRWDPIILSHYPAKFGVNRPCENGDIIFLFVTWPRYRSVTWLCGWGLLILSHHPAKIGVHRPSGTGSNGICNINSNSNSNSNAEVPMARFTNGLKKSTFIFIFKDSLFYVHYHEKQKGNGTSY